MSKPNLTRRFSNTGRRPAQTDKQKVYPFVLLRFGQGQKNGTSAGNGTCRRFFIVSGRADDDEDASCKSE